MNFLKKNGLKVETKRIGLLDALYRCNEFQDENQKRNVLLTDELICFAILVGLSNRWKQHKDRKKIDVKKVGEYLIKRWISRFQLPIEWSLLDLSSEGWCLNNNVVLNHRKKWEEDVFFADKKEEQHPQVHLSILENFAKNMHRKLEKTCFERRIGEEEPEDCCFQHSIVKNWVRDMIIVMKEGIFEEKTTPEKRILLKFSSELQGPVANLLNTRKLIVLFKYPPVEGFCSTIHWNKTNDVRIRLIPDSSIPKISDGLDSLGSKDKISELLENYSLRLNQSRTKPFEKRRGCCACLCWMFASCFGFFFLFFVFIYLRLKFKNILGEF
jgi:hypothetical protein